MRSDLAAEIFVIDGERYAVPPALRHVHVAETPLR
jgi:hypothetical protein